jgi:predicted metal-dependent phosphoesterase TrpH
MIDLHIHTNHSDGVQSVVQVLEKARTRNIKIISITDHNSVGAYDELGDAEDIKIIRGVELYYANSWRGRAIGNEVLGYNIDTEKMKKFLSQMDDEIKRAEVKNLDILIPKFSTLGFKISHISVLCDMIYHNLLKSARVIKDDILTHEQNRALCEKFGFSKTMSIYDDYIRNPKSPLYSPELNLPKIGIEKCANAIHACGGKCFMAHVFKRTGLNENAAGEYLLELIKNKTIDGVEVYHPLHTPRQIEFLLNFCNTHKIPISGGTDNHNLGDPLGVDADFDWVTL